MIQTIEMIKRVAAKGALLLSVIFVGLAQAQAAGPDQDKLSADIIKAWQARDAEKLAGLYARNGSLFSSPAAGESRDANGLKSYAQALFTAMPDFKLEMQGADKVAGNHVMDRWVVSGTWTNPFPAGPLAGMPATGKSFVLQGASFHQMKDGKLVSTVQYYDNLSFLTQIGAIPAGK